MNALPSIAEAAHNTLDAVFKREWYPDSISVPRTSQARARDSVDRGFNPLPPQPAQLSVFQVLERANSVLK